jgi:hypothetical protein
MCKSDTKQQGHFPCCFAVLDTREGERNAAGRPEVHVSEGKALRVCF